MDSLALVLLSALLLLLLLGSALIVAELVRRRLGTYRNAVGYDVTADYRFPYDSSRGRSIDLTCGEGLLWPAVDAGWQSAFVELTVQSDLLGRLLDPCLEMRLSGRVVRHYIERGGSGRRLFNVTEFLSAAPAAGAVITLQGVHLSWLKAAGARLHLLRDAEPPPGPVLVLSPHPDDAEIAAFGFFSGRPAWIATVTLGDAGPSLYADFFDTEAGAFVEKARMRAWDSMHVPRIAGVPAEQIINLGYFDGTLPKMLRSPDMPVRAKVTGEGDIAKLRVNPLDRGQPPHEATWHNLVADMKTLLTHVKPTAIVLPHPHLDPHPDHQCTTIALLEALTQVGPPAGRLLFYTNHLPGTELYPYGPNDGAVSIPPVHDGSVYFQSVLSVPLDRLTRLRKQIAIETHHDLRPPPCARQPALLKVIRDAMKAPYVHIVRADADYVRRAARPNELFFVVDYSEAGRLHREFLAGFAARS